MGVGVGWASGGEVGAWELVERRGRNGREAGVGFGAPVPTQRCTAPSLQAACTAPRDRSCTSLRLCSGLVAFYCVRFYSEYGTYPLRPHNTRTIYQASNTHRVDPRLRRGSAWRPRAGRAKQYYVPPQHNNTIHQCDGIQHRETIEESTRLRRGSALRPRRGRTRRGGRQRWSRCRWRASPLRTCELGIGLVGLRLVLGSALRSWLESGSGSLLWLGSGHSKVVQTPVASIALANLWVRVRLGLGSAPRSA